MTANTMNLPLFATSARARRTDPDTSHEAAATVDVTHREQQVLDALAGAPGGLTTKEMEPVTGVDRLSLSPRMKPLELKGLVVRTDETRDGSIVWRLS